MGLSCSSLVRTLSTPAPTAALTEVVLPKVGELMTIALLISLANLIEPL